MVLKRCASHTQAGVCQGGVVGEGQGTCYQGLSVKQDSQGNGHSNMPGGAGSSVSHLRPMVAGNLVRLLPRHLSSLNS